MDGDTWKAREILKIFEWEARIASEDSLMVRRKGAQEREKGDWQTH